MAQVKDKKNHKERTAEEKEKSRSLSLSLVLGFSVFGIYLAWELRSSPDTSTVAMILLVVSLIALILTVLNILNANPSRRKSADGRREARRAAHKGRDR
ncbi:MAG: hypothetical protein ACI4NA_00195 [Succinivibrio sp.]